MVYAIGSGTEIFEGDLNNTDIFWNLCSSWGWMLDKNNEMKARGRRMALPGLFAAYGVIIVGRGSCGPLR